MFGKEDEINDQELIEFESKLKQDKTANDNLVGLFSILYKVQERLDNKKLQEEKVKILNPKL